MTGDINNEIATNCKEACWCGGDEFSATPHTAYLKCNVCGTAKLRAGMATGQEAVEDEQSHIYGEHYWHEHMTEQGYAPLHVRARADLTERDQHWLMHVLKYVLPPGRTLELGCAHGAFVKLMSAAGFDAMGMEMSAEIIRKAASWFGVEIAKGPLEAADRDLGLFDAVLAFDVLEHFANPVATMTKVVERLNPEGVIIIQTPCYDKVGDADWRQFNVPEHTFLFSSQSVRNFFTSLGFTHIAEEPAIFGDDMFVFASRVPLRNISPDEATKRLLSTPDSRLVLAMQDMYRRELAAQTADLAEQYGVKRLGKAFVRSLSRSLNRRLGG